VNMCEPTWASFSAIALHRDRCILARACYGNSNAHGNAKINVMHADARTAYERKKVSNEHERR
jgi:hypothetical protein